MYTHVITISEGESQRYMYNPHLSVHVAVCNNTAMGGELRLAHYMAAYAVDVTSMCSLLVYIQTR